MEDGTGEILRLETWFCALHFALVCAAVVGRAEMGSWVKGK